MALEDRLGVVEGAIILRRMEVFNVAEPVLEDQACESVPRVVRVYDSEED